MVDRNKFIVLGGLLIGPALVVGGMIWRRRKRYTTSKLPSGTRWKHIGTLKNLLIFPLKSGGCTELEEADCTEIGPAEVSTPGLYSLRDRHFMVYRYDTGKMMVCMTYPILLTITVQPYTENSVLFKHKDKPELVVKVPTPEDSNKARLRLECMAHYLDCGDKAADWLTDIIKGDKNAPAQMRLGYWAYPDNWTHGTDENYNNSGSYQIYSSYMLLTSSSINDIARRIPDHPLTYRQFRPNFYVDTTNVSTFSEDHWKWVKIGEEAIFLKSMNCYRCPQVNINPETAEFSKKFEPLKVLLTYRKFNKSADPTAGICMGLYKAGKVKVGDPVYFAI